MSTPPAAPLLGFGLGLRAPHYDDILNSQPKVDWFEVISENYMYSHGRLRHLLEKVRERYPVVMHGVSLSIGTVDPLNSDYLKKLRELEAWLQPAWISDHLCWTGVAHKNTHDLLPLPYTEESLSHIVDRIKRVQDILGRPLVLENPSTYLEFSASTMPEEIFIARMAQESGCGLLLDVNNIYVSCHNHQKNCRTYIDALPLGQVWQIHLAGHTDHGTHLFDTHSGPMIDPVWNLYKYVLAKAGHKNTMIEWDEDIPEFSVLMHELDKARLTANDAALNSLVDFSDTATRQPSKPELLSELQTKMQETILALPELDSAKNDGLNWIAPKGHFTQRDQANIYVMGYRQRLFDVVNSDYPALRAFLGDKNIDMLLRGYVHNTPSTFRDAGLYGKGLGQYVAKLWPDDNVTSELALFESAVAQAEHLPETAAATFEDLHSFATGELEGVTLVARSALILLSLEHDINTLYSALLNGETADNIPRVKSFVAVLRHDWQTWRIVLSKEEYSALTSLQQSTSLEDFLASLREDEAGLVAQMLGRWIQHGLIAITNDQEQINKPERITA